METDAPVPKVVEEEVKEETKKDGDDEGSDTVDKTVDVGSKIEKVSLGGRIGFFSTSYFEFLAG